MGTNEMFQRIMLHLSSW